MQCLAGHYHARLNTQLLITTDELSSQYQRAVLQALLQLRAEAPTSQPYRRIVFVDPLIRKVMRAKVPDLDNYLVFSTTMQLTSWAHNKIQVHRSNGRGECGLMSGFDRHCESAVKPNDKQRHKEEAAWKKQAGKQAA